MLSIYLCCVCVRRRLPQRATQNSWHILFMPNKHLPILTTTLATWWKSGRENWRLDFGCGAEFTNTLVHRKHDWRKSIAYVRYIVKPNRREEIEICRRLSLWSKAQISRYFICQSLGYDDSCMKMRNRMQCVPCTQNAFAWTFRIMIVWCYFGVYIYLFLFNKNIYFSNLMWTVI